MSRADDAAVLRPFRPMLWLVAAAVFMQMLDTTIVNTALPRIVADLGGASHLSWVVTAFLLTSTATTPLYGKLSDMYGRKRLFYLAITIFLAGSVLCGLAQDMLQLLIDNNIAIAWRSGSSGFEFIPVNALDPSATVFE